ncbi:MAG: UvrD-helicase domain-containing protein, partial [Sandaracinaceae bacterium]|nr:UvrD-helicase domain-containing protein [Sandaracinaceae bacterium]
VLLALHVRGRARAQRAAGGRSRRVLPEEQGAHWIAAVERARTRDYDDLERALSALRREKCWARRGTGTWFTDGVLRQDVRSRRDAARDLLDEFLRDAGADLAACLQRDLWPVVEAYEALKTRTGTLDFLDLLIRARDLVRDRREVREELRARTRAIFVDEFQDTDPLQAELLLMLAGEGELGPNGALADDAPPPARGKLFVVGDPKQSIYRFRRADVTLYERLKTRLRAHGVPVLELTTSFRATPSIQRVVNTAFVDHMQGGLDGAQAHYVPLSEHRAPPSDRPEVVVLPVPHPYGRYGKVWRYAAHASYADAVGAFVHWLIEESGWTIDDPHTHATRRIESRDVCLLFRQMAGFGADLCRSYVLALEARDVPHVLVGGRAFHDREEIAALATALRAIEHPSDALGVYATLRGPFFALSDEQLLLHSARVGPLHPLSPTYAEALWSEDKAVPEALDVLRQLHLGRNRAPIAETIAMLLDLVRAHIGIAHWPNGEQALANVLRVMELARRFEAQGGLSFRAFVERLEDQLARGEGVSAPVVEERSAGVRVMTVHRDKGLEFPVVVLCDPLLSRVPEHPSRYSDSASRLWVAPLAGCVPHELDEHRQAVLHADEAEEIRLAYVASTRARDLLVVPGFGDGAEPGWVDPLFRAVYPERGARASDAPGCPAFGRDSVLERPIDVSLPLHGSVMPGLHTISGARVVWWDPAVLELGRVPGGGLRRHGLLGPGREDDDGARRISEHARWVDARETLLARAAERSFRAKPVTTLAAERMGASAPPRIEETTVDRLARPGGTRFGTLVHATLAEVDLDADRASVAALVSHFAALLVATDDERRAAIEAVVAALAHPIFTAARGAAEVRRESPIMLRDGEEIVEGVIDLVFLNQGRWSIVDFKTDRERGDGSIGQYAAQLELYANAVTAATGQPTETVLFYV